MEMEMEMEIDRDGRIKGYMMGKVYSLHQFDPYIDIIANFVYLSSAAQNLLVFSKIAFFITTLIWMDQTIIFISTNKILIYNQQQNIQCKEMDEFFRDELDLYFSQQNSEFQRFRKPSLTVQKSCEPMPTQKTKINTQINKPSSIKGKYIDKLKEYSQNQDSYAIFQGEEGGSIPSLSRRERNRISAKQSRDRKKLYIQLMEIQQRKLQKQFQELDKQIDQMKSKINKFCSSNKSTVGFAARGQLEGKLESVLQNNSNNCDQQINILLDSITYRVGATGRQRIQKQNQCYKQIVNLSLPALHRYLMWATTENKHLFSPCPSTELEAEDFVCPLVQIIQKQEKFQEIHQQLQEVKGQVIKRKDNLAELIARLWEKKESIQQIIKNLQDEMSTLRQIFSPQQVAKFILFVSRNKYINSLQFFVEQPEPKMKKQETESGQMSKPKKRLKVQKQEHKRQKDFNGIIQY